MNKLSKNNVQQVDPFHSLTLHGEREGKTDSHILKLRDSLSGKPRSRAETVGMFIEGSKPIRDKINSATEPLVLPLLDRIQDYLATRPLALVEQQLPYFRRRVVDVIKAHSSSEPNIKALRLSALEEAHHGAQLALLGARLFNAVTAFKKWELTPFPAQTVQLKKAIQETSKLWTHAAEPVKSLPMQWNCRYFLNCALTSLSGEHTDMNLLKETLKCLTDLIRFEHQWIRWATPHNLSPRSAPSDLGKVQYKYDALPQKAIECQSRLEQRITFTTDDPQGMLKEIKSLRESWSRSISFLMPAGATPFLVHFRDTLPPDEFIREMHISQHLWHIMKNPKAGSDSISELRGKTDSAEWIRKRLESSRASLFAFIAPDRTMHSFYLVLYDEELMPPGPSTVIGTVVGDEPLNAAKAKAGDYSEFIFADLLGLDPRNLSDIGPPDFRAMKLLHRAAFEFGELDAHGIRPVSWFAICKTHPDPNPSISRLLAAGWSDTGLCWENPAPREIYAILGR